MQNFKFFRQNPAFTFLWMSRLVFFFGETLATTALVLFLAGKGSGTLVSGVLAAQTLPRLLGPLLGSLVDRIEQRKFMLLCYSGRILSSAAILLLLDSLPLLPLLAAVSTLFNTGTSITGKSYLPHAVREQDLPAANALFGLGGNAAMAFVPAAAGALFELIGVKGLLGLSTLLFGLAWVLTHFLPRVAPQAKDTRMGGFLRSTWEGIRSIGQHKVARAVSLSLFLSVLFAAYGSVAMVFLVQDVLNASPAKYGMVQSFYGIGMVLAPLLCLGLVRKVNPRYFLFTAVALLGVGNLFTGLAPSLVVVTATLSIAGMGNGLQNLANDTIIQQGVPRQVLGRLFGTVYAGAHLAAALAYAAGGPILDLTDPRFVYVTAGIGVLLSLAAALFLFSPRHLSGLGRERMAHMPRVRQVAKG